MARRVGRVAAGLGWLLLSAIFLVLLSSLARVDDVPAYVVLALTALAAVSVFRPSWGLLLLTVVVPVATWLGQTWHGGVAWPETVVVAFGCGYAARQMSPRQHIAVDDLSGPTALAIAVILASLAVHLLFVSATSGAAPLRSEMWTVLTKTYFVDPSFRQLDATMRLLEGLILLRAARAATGRETTLAPRLVRGVVLGAAAAGAVNVWHLWNAAARLESPASVFLSYATTLRFNAQYGDVNAAGSYYVMTLFPAVALAVRNWRPTAIVAAVLIGFSLSMSGSRAALVAGAVGGLALAARSFAGRVPRHIRQRTIAIVALGIVVTAYAVLRNRTPSLLALTIRAGFAQTSLRMLESNPLYGIGIGEFWMRSGEFSPHELLALYPPAQHENAHNNFLQLLAELGLIGFAALGWVLTAAGIACSRHFKEPARDWVARSATAGLLAFVVSWLAGHPLLLDSPAISFWLLLGTMAGWGAPVPAPTARNVTWMPVIVIVALAVFATVPLRVRDEIARANLEHQGIGLSEWHYSPDGIRFRFAGRQSTVYVPSDTAIVSIPLRAATAGSEVVVNLQLDGRPADVVRVSSDRWNVLRLRLPAGRETPRFSRVDLIVEDQSTAGDLLMVGKAEAR